MQTISDQRQILQSFLTTGVRTASQIRQHLNCSQPTVSRLLSQIHNDLVIIGQARARRYTRLRAVSGLNGEVPVYEIDNQGNAHVSGYLLPIAVNEFLWRSEGNPDQVFRSLPWFLADLYPDGFIGRAFVGRLHEEFGFPPRGLDWKDDHVLVALARRGEDTMGNVVIGRESIERYFQMVHSKVEPIANGSIPEGYLRMAADAMNGQPCGSSAGGEQPKFTTTIERNGAIKQVLVKFSPPVGTEVGRRWGDLLICEHLALQIIQETAPATAVHSRIVDAGERVFLEVERFDRVGIAGRLPMISLRAIDAELYGYQDNWINAANRMQRDKKLSAVDAAGIRWLSVFGRLIGNDDQHFGNISFVMDKKTGSFVPTPAYDMVPMFYRPVDGAIRVRAFSPPAAVAGAESEWGSAFTSAGLFWERAANDSKISDGFRTICRENQANLGHMHEGPRLID